MLYFFQDSLRQFYIGLPNLYLAPSLGWLHWLHSDFTIKVFASWN